MFLQHGLLGSSSDWVISGKDKGLGEYVIYSEIVLILYNFLQTLEERMTYTIPTLLALFFLPSHFHINSANELKL